MIIKNMRLLFLLCLPILFLAGCQPKVYLMPPPIGLEPDTNFFNLTENNKDDNKLYTLYATNRIPHNLSTKHDGYTIFPSDNLRLGYVVHTVGGDNTTWEELRQKSLSRQRDEDLLISLQDVHESLYVEDGEPLSLISPTGKDFFLEINKRLETTADKDITIYVHGANSNFYRATSQGAQYFHFTGHNSIVLTFSWPSAENILKYKTDVMHAKKTVPAFARLLELLALHTTARNINILAYSAGAQVAAPGLVYLRNAYSELDPDMLRERFRIGEVYFAAPDIETESFVERYLRFKDIVQRTTISANVNDSVLRFARLHTGKSRLGRPDELEITAVEKQIIYASSKSGIFDILDIEGSQSLQAGTSHNFWYNHPWVSTDLLLLMLLNYPPEKRGLVSYQTEYGMEVWHFLEDYESRLQVVLDELREKQ